MAMEKVQLGDLSVSRFILGGNPFSGHAHQTPERADEMRHYYTAARIKEVLRQAEELEIDTFVGRTDAHIVRLLMEYWDEGGRIQWIAQTAPELQGIRRAVEMATRWGARACYIHGGQMDNLVANGATEEIAPTIDMIRQAGLPAGVAGHLPETFTWAEENLDVDFYMCSYYNPSDRSRSPEGAPRKREQYLAEDRDAMVAKIQTLSKPAIHYKVLAAGRNEPGEAFEFLAKHIRPQDAVCVGVFPKDKPDMLAEDVELFKRALAGRREEAE